jgi:hypothetical protein
MFQYLGLWMGMGEQLALDFGCIILVCGDFFCDD